MSGNLSDVFFLVVDDNRHMQKIVTAILHAFGATKIVCAESAEAAMCTLQREPIDIVITDEHMTGMSGSELCKEIRTGESVINPYVPVIVLSAFSHRTNVIRARDSGATEFCVKPVSAMALFQRIASVIDNPRPFVRARSFVGPDRRRHDLPEGKGPNRRATDESAEDAA